MNTLKRKIIFILMNTIGSSVILSSKLRVLVYQFCGMEIGENAFIYANCFFNDSNIKIGKGTFINHKCVFENNARVEIGNDCSIGMEVLFCSATHEIGPERKRVGKIIGLPITMEDGCWIGSRVTILPGVTIGKGCVLGAGALITTDCEPNGLYMGVPARRFRDLPVESSIK